jgi:hypothetical protein
MVSLQEIQWRPLPMVERALLERDLEAYFSRQCKKLKLLTLKLHVRYARGWPDRIVVLPRGRTLWVELKRPGGKTSPLQDQLHQQLKDLEHDIYVLDSKEGIDRVLGTA